MRVVFDTNIWLSAIFWKGEASKIIDYCIDKNIEIIITEKILSEISDVLNREIKFQKFMENRKQSIEDLIRTILSISILIDTESKIELIKDHPQDNIILESALDGKADYIISYDTHILNMIEFREIKILEPKDFFEIIR
jgi:uncharacterized protein